MYNLSIMLVADRLVAEIPVEYMYLSKLKLRQESSLQSSCCGKFVC